MSLPQRQIRIAEDPGPPAPRIDRRAKAEFDSHMVMIRCLVDETDDRETARYRLRAMAQQCRILAKRFELKADVE